MKGRGEVLRSVVSVSMLICLACVGCTRQGLNVDEAIAANKELDHTIIEAFKAKDIDAIMNCWWKSADAAFYPADNIEGQKGWDAIRASVRLAVEGMEKVVSVELTEPRYSVLGDAVMGTGVLTMHIVPKGSPKEITLATRYTDLRKQIAGKWVYVYGHESMNPMLGSELTVGR